MNQLTRTPSDETLKVFDAGLKDLLAPIGPYLGIDPISLMFDKVELPRISAVVEFGFHVTTARYSTVSQGKVEFDGVPTLKGAAVEGYMKEAGNRLFKSSVSAQNLREEILSGNADKPPRIVCDSVEAVSHEDCNNCDRGIHACGGCGGSGSSVCNNCRAYARFPGMVTCHYCHGTGGNRDAGTNEWYNCVTCRGHKQLICGTCAGSTKVRCGGCSGDGTQYCGSCGGHGFYTSMHSYKIEMGCQTNPLIDGVSAGFKTGVLMWVRNGMPNRASDRASVEAWSDIDDAQPIYVGWEGNLFSAGMRLTCEATVGDPIGVYDGKRGWQPVGVGYIRFGRDFFGLSPFLDEDLKAHVDKVIDIDGQPGKWLEGLSGAPGIAAGLRKVDGTTGSKAVFLSDAGKVLNGAVRPELLDIVVDGYIDNLRGFEKSGSKRAGWDAVMVVVTAWVAMWFFEGFQFIASLPRTEAKIAAVVLALLVAISANGVVKIATRRRVRKETSGGSAFKVGWPGKLACLVGGGLFSFLGLLSAVNGY